MHVTNRYSPATPRNILQYTIYMRDEVFRVCLYGGHAQLSTQTNNTCNNRNGMQRELAEEMIIECSGKDQIVGLIYDDSSEVGRVHLGIVHVLQLATCKATPREDQLLDAGFESLETIKEESDRMETWSQLCFKHLY